jgi:hypothetical protein
MLQKFTLTHHQKQEQMSEREISVISYTIPHFVVKIVLTYRIAFPILSPVKSYFLSNKIKQKGNFYQKMKSTWTEPRYFAVL